MSRVRAPVPLARLVAVLALVTLAGCGSDDATTADGSAESTGLQRYDDHRHHLQGRHGRRPRGARSRSRPASRSTCTSPPTSPARSTCTARPSRRSSITPAPPTRRSPSTSPGVVDVESHHARQADRPARGALSAPRGPALVLLVPLHGLGGAKDLPIPLGLAIAGATAALVVSFCVLALAWRTPRYQELAPGPPGAPVARAAGRRPRLPVDAAGRSGLLFFGYLVWALIWGPDLVTNPVLGTFYVLVWVGLVPASLLFGPVVRAVSPVRTLNLLLARLTGGDPAAGLVAYPARLGYWPAAAGLFAFVWQELVNPQSAYLGSVRIWLAVVPRRDADRRRASSATCGSSGPTRSRSTPACWRSSPSGAAGRHSRLVVRSPLANLATVDPAPGPGRRGRGAVRLHGLRQLQGHAAVAAVRAGRGPRPRSSPTRSPCWCSASWSAARSPPPRCRRAWSTDRPPRRTPHGLPGLLAHSVIPIIVGYMTAHYLSYLVEQGQTHADPAQRPDGAGRQPARHRQLVGELLALVPPDAARGHQGAGRRHRPHRRRDRRPRPRDQAAATAPPRDRPDRDADRDGRLHGDRALPADGRASEPSAQRRPRRGPRRARGAAAESPSSTTDLPATSALSVVGRSSGRKCTPAGRM